MSTEPQPATQTPQPGAPQQQPGPQPQQPGPQPQTQALPHHTIRHTRISGLWFAVGFFAVLLLFLLIFILQNEQKVDISFLGAHGHLPLGVALLLAAVGGVLLAIAAGVARMAQLRSVARKHRRADTQRQASAQRQAGPQSPTKQRLSAAQDPRDAPGRLAQLIRRVGRVAQHQPRRPG